MRRSSNRIELLGQLSAAIVSIRRDDAVRVAIDGIDGASKTTLVTSRRCAKVGAALLDSLCRRATLVFR
jgi:hypothetical protein